MSAGPGQVERGEVGHGVHGLPLRARRRSRVVGGAVRSRHEPGVDGVGVTEGAENLALLEPDWGLAVVDEVHDHSMLTAILLGRADLGEHWLAPQYKSWRSGSKRPSWPTGSSEVTAAKTVRDVWGWMTMGLVAVTWAGGLRRRGLVL